MHSSHKWFRFGRKDVASSNGVITAWHYNAEAIQLSSRAHAFAQAVLKLPVVGAAKTAANRCGKLLSWITVHVITA
jgi:hypothetical protein